MPQSTSASRACSGSSGTTAPVWFQPNRVFRSRTQRRTVASAPVKFMLLHQTLPHPVRGVALLDGLVRSAWSQASTIPATGSITGQAGSFSRRYLGSCPGQYFPDRPSRVPGLPAICRMLFL